jgi:kynurenine formamidase
LDAAEFLVKADVGLVGTDCVSLDRFGEAGLPAHKALLGAQMLISRAVMLLKHLPANTLWFAHSLRVLDRIASPVRAVFLERAIISMINDRESRSLWRT